MSSTNYETSSNDETDTKKTWSYYYHYSNGESIVKSHHILGVLVILGLVLLFHFRHKIAEAHDRYRMRRRLGRYSTVGGFDEDLENGFNSNNFNIESNIHNNDPRGLLEEAKVEIKRLMTTQRLSFDEARLQYTQSQLNRHGINKDGMPADPKLVTF